MPFPSDEAQLATKLALLQKGFDRGLFANIKLPPKGGNSKTQKLKNSKTQKLKNSKTQKLKNSRTQELKNSKTQKTQKLKNSKTQKPHQATTMNYLCSL